MPKMPLMKWIDIPPAWLVGHLVVMFTLSAWLPGLAVRHWALGLLGWGLILTGLVLTLAALREFRRAQTTPIPHQMPKSLVTSGVFRISRNPIYLGDAAFLAGFTLLQGQVVLLALVAVFAWIITRRFILPEEGRLKTRFEGAFAAWCQQTRRWI